MLTLTIPAQELYNEKTKEFVTTKEYTLKLEHSLLSLSKWESKWQKPFISRDTKTKEETLDYIKCMTITPNVPDEVYKFLTNDNINTINNYIQSSQTATTIKDTNGRRSNEIVTAELIYYWMIDAGIEKSYETWHLNRLFTLIRVCNIKSQPAKKMSKNDILKQNALANAKRRRK